MYPETKDIVDWNILKELAREHKEFSLDFQPANEYKCEEKDSREAPTQFENLSPERIDEPTGSHVSPHSLLKKLSPEVENLSPRETQTNLPLGKESLIVESSKEKVSLSSKVGSLGSDENLESLSPEESQSFLPLGKDSVIGEPSLKIKSQPIEEFGLDVSEDEQEEDVLVVDLESLSPLDVINIIITWGKIEISLGEDTFQVEKLKKRKSNKPEPLLPPNLSPTSSRGGISYRIHFTKCGKKCKCRSGRKHGGYLTVRWWEAGTRREKSIGRANLKGASI